MAFEVFLKDWIFIVLVALLPISVVLTTDEKEDILDSGNNLSFYSSILLAVKFLIMDLRLKRFSLAAALALCLSLFLLFGQVNLFVTLVTSDLSLSGVLLFLLHSAVEAVCVPLYHSFFILKMKSKTRLAAVLFFLLGGVWLNFWINGKIKDGRLFLPRSLQILVFFLVPPVSSGATSRCIL